MNFANERFFLTGGTGFVGSCLTRQLLKLGADVHLLVRNAADYARLEDIKHQLTFHVGDLIGTNLPSIVGAIQPTVIYHLAVHGAYPFQTDADETIRTNVFGTWNLLKACASVNYKVFVNAGSSSEYGSKSQAMRETDVLEPNSYYAVAKSAQTLVCQHTAHLEQRPINTFRLFSVYGPYEESSRLVPTVIRHCLEGKSLAMVTPETARDFVFVDDVVAAFLDIERLQSFSGEVFNIGTGSQSTVLDVVNAISKATGKVPSIQWGAMGARPWDTETWVADCTKTRRMMGWSATTQLIEGISRTVAWQQQQLTSAKSRRP
tara:strand:- start:6134 stop:7090 length:957 start_codon:yes stop_codon:yes gene_type:complete